MGVVSVTLGDQIIQVITLQEKTCPCAWTERGKKNGKHKKCEWEG